MTTYNVATAKHATLGAATEDIVNLANALRTVTVINRDATATNLIFIRIGPTAGGVVQAGAPIAPTSGGADNDICLTGGTGPASRFDFVTPSADGKITVRVIGAAASPYSVQSCPLIET